MRASHMLNEVVSGVDKHLRKYRVLYEGTLSGGTPSKHQNWLLRRQKQLHKIVVADRVIRRHLQVLHDAHAWNLFIVVYLHPGDILVEVELVPLVCVKVEVAVHHVEALLKWVVRDEERLLHGVDKLCRQSKVGLLLETLVTEPLR